MSAFERLLVPGSTELPECHWPSLPGFWVVAFPVGSDGPGRQRIAALKAAGTPVDIASQAGNGAAEMLAALIRPHLTPVATPPRGIAKLPLIELPAKPSGPLLAIVLSGDGGWRDLDKTISEKLQSTGVLSSVGTACGTSGAESRPNR